MKRAALIGTIAAGVLVLGGVGTAIAVSQLPEPEPEPTSTVAEAPETSESPEPLVAETPEPSDDVSDADSTDAEFVAYVRGELLWDTGIADATDEQLITAAHEACELLLEGVDGETIRLVEGEEPAASGYYMDSAAIIDGARRFYCPETIF